MVVKIDVSAELPANAATYMLERDSAAFRSLLAKMLKLSALEFQEIWLEGSSTFVKLASRPKFGAWVPKGVQSQLGNGNIEFQDIIEYAPKNLEASPYSVNVRTVSPFLGDKLDVRLVLSVEALGEGRCRQRLRGTVDVSLFGVGRIVEGIVRDSLASTYKQLPEVVRRWQAFRSDALAVGNGAALLLGRPPFGADLAWVHAEVAAILQEPPPASAFAGTAATVAEASPSKHGPEPDGALELEVQRSESIYYDAAEDWADALPRGCDAGLRGAVRLDRMRTAQQLGALPGARPPVDVIHLPSSPPRLAARPGHRRTGSADSNCSVDLSGISDSELERKVGRLSTSKGLWRRFNRQYKEWSTVWDELGVEGGAEAANPATVRLVHVLEQAQRSGALQVVSGGPAASDAGRCDAMGVGLGVPPSPIPEVSVTRGREPSWSQRAASLLLPGRTAVAAGPAGGPRRRCSCLGACFGGRGGSGRAEGASAKEVATGRIPVEARVS